MSGNIGKSFGKIFGGLETLLSPITSPSVKALGSLGVPTMPELTGAEQMKEMSRKAKKNQPKTMPTPDSEQAALAKRRSVSQQRTRSGRASTILTNEESLG